MLNSFVKYVSIGGTQSPFYFRGAGVALHIFFLKSFLVNETFVIYDDVLGYCFYNDDCGCGHPGQRQAGA